MTQFQEKYRSESHRKPGWDYSSNGRYFITLIIQNRNHFFGRIKGKKMLLNAWGQIAKRQWLKSFELRSEMFSEEFIIMPDHLHAIVKIEKPILPVDRHGRAYLQEESKIFHRQPQSVSSFVAGYKAAVNTQINNYIDQNPGKELFHVLGKFTRKNRLWQPNYYDRVIRDDVEFIEITNYIRSNPARWQDT